MTVLTEQFSVARAAHDSLMASAATWEAFGKTVLQSIIVDVTSPNYTVTWENLTGAVPITWGAAYTPPVAPDASPYLQQGPQPISLIPYGPQTTVTPPTAPQFSSAAVAPTGTMPAVNIRALGDVSLPSMVPFSTTVPASTINELTAAFIWDAPAYVGRMDGYTESVMRGVLQGNPLVGQAVFDGIFAKAAGNLATAYVDGVYDAGVASGMTGELPSESRLARIDKAAGEYRQGLQRVALETSTQQAMQWSAEVVKILEIANQHESLWSALWLNESGMRLRAASAAVEAAVAVHNGKVAHYNAILAAVQADTAISAEHRARAMLTLDGYKLQIEARQSDLAEFDGNLRRLVADYDIYKTKVGTEAAVFSSQVQAFSSEVAGNQAIVETQRIANATITDQNTAQVNLYGAQWAGVKVAADAALTSLTAAALPGDQHIKSETARLSAEMAQLQLAVENAKLSLSKGQAEAQLYISQAQHLDGLRKTGQSLLANVVGNIVSAKYGAGNVNMSAGASVGYSETTNLTPQG